MTIRKHYNVEVEDGDLTGIDKSTKYYKKARNVWRSILQRCYDTKLHINESTYKNCEICEEWKIFKNFYIWFCEHYYELENESVQLDKDIICKGNKLYSPEYCSFVPHTINSLFTKSNKCRGDTPIGVSWIERDKVYRAQCNNGYKKRIGLGDYDNPIDAFKAYKKYKEYIIKTIAEKYKNVIEQKVYDAMLNYTVEITD